MNISVARGIRLNTRYLCLLVKNKYSEILRVIPALAGKTEKYYRTRFFCLKEDRHYLCVG